jgi:autotransporter-associated beta strand protein
MPKLLAGLGLSFCLLALPALGAPHVWTGAASDLFSNAANWSGGSPAGDANADLSFPAGSRLTARNDLAGLTVRSIAFSATGYTISGNAIALTSGAAITDSTAGPNVIANDLTLPDELIVTAPGDIYFSPGLTLSGSISGAGGIRLLGGGRLLLSGTTANTYTGITRVLNGELQLRKSAGTAALNGPVLIDGTGGNYEYGYLSTFADEQIPNSLPVTVGSSGTLGIGAVETLGAITVERSGNIQTSTVWSGFITQTGRLILGGDIRIGTGLGINDADVYGTLYLPATRTISQSPGYYGSSLSSFSGAPGAGLIVTADSSDPTQTKVTVGGTYDGPTIVQSGSTALNNTRSTAIIRGGRLSGSAAAVTGESGQLTGDSLNISGNVTLSASMTLSFQYISDYSKMKLNGTLSLGGATLQVPEGNGTRRLGDVYTIISNASAVPTVGTFKGLPEGAVMNDRWRVSYVGGDGNDVTLTEAGHLVSGIGAASSPSDPVVGDPLTLLAHVSVYSTNPVTATGTVTFSEGATLLATATLNGSADAAASVTLPSGNHTITARYGGDAITQPSQTTFGLTVREKTPTVTAVEPVPVPGGQTTTLTIRGTNFLNGSVVYIDHTGGAATYISPTELRYEYKAPSYTSEYDAELQVSQPGYWAVFSNIFKFRVTAGPPPTPTQLVFGAQSVTAPVTPGAQTAWLSVARRPLGYSSAYETRINLLTDTDNDGSVTFSMDQTVPPWGIWTTVDMSARAILAGNPAGTVPTPAEFPKKLFLRNENGTFSHMILPKSGVWNMIWVRPGVGGWFLIIGDGGQTDLDKASNGLIVCRTSMFQPFGTGTPSVPAGFEPGDLLVAIDGGGEQWFGDRVDDHLAESAGAGAISFVDVYSLPISESAGVAKLLVLRRDGTDGAVTARYSTANDTAIAGEQYIATSDTVRFEAGEILKTIEIPLIDDSIYSGNTSFKVALSDPAGATIATPSTIPVSLTDNDPVPVLSVVVASPIVQEGDSGTRDIPITLKLTGTTRKPVTSGWYWSDQPGGYSTHSNEVRFEPGETQKTVNVTYTANTKPEPDRGISIWIYNTVGATPGAGASLTIADDDFATISIADASIGEANGSANVTLSLSEASLKPVIATYTIRDGSATSGSDYIVVATGTITMQGQLGTRQTLPIPIVNDSLPEGPEWLTVTLSNVQNGRLGRATGVVNIVDDDTPAMSAPSGLAATAAGSARVNVNWFAVPNAVSYEVYRSSGGNPYTLIGTSSGPAYVDNAVAENTTYLYKTRALGNGGAASGFSAQDAATTVIFTDNTLSGAAIKAAHVLELRLAVGAMRTAAGLTPFSFADPALNAGTMIKASHITQLRSALDQARAALALPTLAYTDATLASAATTVKGAHLEELRSRCR